MNVLDDILVSEVREALRNAKDNGYLYTGWTPAGIACDLSLLDARLEKYPVVEIERVVSEIRPIDKYAKTPRFPTREIDQHTSGAKLDDGKVDMSLLEYLPKAITEVCRVMTYGKVKYTRGGFLDVPEGVDRYSAAMLRHYFAAKTEGLYDKDPWYDTPKGLEFKDKILHDAQVATNALFRLELLLRERHPNP